VQAFAAEAGLDELPAVAVAAAAVAAGTAAVAAGTAAAAAAAIAVAAASSAVAFLAAVAAVSPTDPFAAVVTAQKLHSSANCHWASVVAAVAAVEHAAAAAAAAHTAVAAIAATAVGAPLAAAAVAADAAEAAPSAAGPKTPWSFGPTQASSSACQQGPTPCDLACGLHEPTPPPWVQGGGDSRLSCT